MSKETDQNSNSDLKYAKRSYYVAVATLALSVLGVSMPSQAQVSAIICDGRWQTVPAVDVTRQFGDFNSLNAVAALSSTDVLAVGQWQRFSGTDYSHALVEHWDGTSWAVMQTPHPSLAISILFGVAALSSNDVWAVGYEESLTSGYRTLIEHWDGSAWTIIQDGTHEGWLTSVSAIAPDDVWAVGSTNYVGQGLIEHWDGTTWTQTLLQDAVFLRSVTAINQSDVWAVGQLPHDSEGDYTYAVHFDGSSWTQVPTPSPLQRHTSDQNWLTSVTALASDDVWAAGIMRDPDYGILDRTLIEHWDGTTWTVVPSPRQGDNVNNDFWGIVAFDPSNVWAVGSLGNDPDFAPLIEHWDGTAWTPVAPASTGGVLLGLAGIGSNMELWSTGYRTKHNRYTGTLVQHLCTGD